MSVLVDEDREHLLCVLLLAVLCYRFGIDHDLLSRNSLWSLLLHHLLLLHVAHSVIELHVVVPNEHSLLSHDLLLLSLVWELTSAEELILETWLTAIRRLQHIRVDKDGSCVHQHSLLAIRTLSWSTELRRPCVLVIASGSDISHLAWVEHCRSHQGLLLRIHLRLHVHLFPISLERHLWHSHLQFRGPMSEGTLIPIRTISAAFEEFAFDGLIVVVFILEIVLEVLTTLGLVVASTLVHSSASASSIVAAWHAWRHSSSRITLEVVIISAAIATTTTTSATIVVTRHAILLEASSEVSRLLESISLTVSIWRPRLHWHTSHCCSFHMFGNRLQ